MKSTTAELKQAECCKAFREKLRQVVGIRKVLPKHQTVSAKLIRKTGASGKKVDKDIWSGNEEIKDCIQRKRLAKKWTTEMY